MRALITNSLLVAAAFVLSSCGNEPKAGEKLGKGQVIATVNGEDVTVYELSTELQGINLPAGDARKRIEQATLQKIVDRKILADIARERKLDKSPQYLLQTRRADEMLLVNLLQQDVAGKVRAPTSEEVEKYIAANPSTFSQRKLLIIDQIQFPMPADRKDLMKYQPLKTLDEVEQKLIEGNVDYRRVPNSLDTAQLPAHIAKNILALPMGEVFIVPSGGGLTANRITEVRTIPLIGPEAAKAAKEMIRKQRMIELATTEFDPLIKGAREKAVYQPGYEPAAAQPSGSPAPAK